MPKNDKQATLDQYLTYTTAKMVIVRDWKLGLMYYSLMLLIFVYIIWNAVSTGSYLTKSTPTAGSVRATAQLNTTGLTVPSYCSTSADSTLGCVFWPAEQMAYPFSGEANTLFITTRVSITQVLPDATNACTNLTAPTSAACRALPPKNSLYSRKSYYVANIEDLTFQIDHSVRYQPVNTFGASTLFTKSELDMTGILKVIKVI